MSQLPFPRAILSQHSATLGKTGAGKSSALRVSVEDLLTQKKRVVIIDPKGDWWGLKSSADGKGAGFPVITFGDFKEPYGRGDVPINERSGAHVAELIAGGNRPCVIGFRGWMPGHMMQFWIGQGTDPHRADGFLPTLFNKNEGELYVFVDEVQNFAAKGKILSPQAGLCVHWTNKAMSESRGMGMTFHIASQRSQKVHNDTLDCCETLVGMRTAHPAARKSIEDWINSKGDPVFSQEVLSTLAELKRGEAWVWSPENEFGPKRVQFPMFQTFDSFAPPQLQKKVSQAGWSEVNLDQVREKLSAVIAEAKANDPKELRAQVVELKRELAKKQASVPRPVVKADENHDRRVAERAAKSATAPLLKRLHEFQRYAAKVSAYMATTAEALQKISNAELPPEEAPAPVPASQPRTELARPVQMPPRQVRETIRPTNGNGHGQSLPPGERAILIAVAQFGECERDQLTVLTGYKRSSRDAYVARLAAKGYIEANGGALRPTQDGVDALGSDYEPLPTGDALYKFWRGRLPEGELRILDVLVRQAAPLNRNDLDEPTGYKRSSRDAYLSRLAARRLIEVPASGMVQAATALFD
jgi:hypothetical protein